MESAAGRIHICRIAPGGKQPAATKASRCIGQRPAPPEAAEILGQRVCGQPDRQMRWGRLTAGGAAAKQYLQAEEKTHPASCQFSAPACPPAVVPSLRAHETRSCPARIRKRLPANQTVVRSYRTSCGKGLSGVSLSASPWEALMQGCNLRAARLRRKGRRERFQPTAARSQQDGAGQKKKLRENLRAQSRRLRQGLRTPFGKTLLQFTNLRMRTFMATPSARKVNRTEEPP